MNKLLLLSLLLLVAVLLPLDQDTMPTGKQLTVPWGDLGQKLIEAGVVDRSKISPTQTQFYTQSPSNLVITGANSHQILNLLWAFGLANKNRILETGPMTDLRYGDPSHFASTGGWTLAVGEPMDHYSQHQLVVLTETEQQVVERVAKNVYRPCCGNPAYFPDCNHGMAMLGLLELLASRGASADDLYAAASTVNSYWFPGVYENSRCGV